MPSSSVQLPTANCDRLNASGCLRLRPRPKEVKRWYESVRVSQTRRLATHWPSVCRDCFPLSFLSSFFSFLLYGVLLYLHTSIGSHFPSLTLELHLFLSFSYGGASPSQKKKKKRAANGSEATDRKQRIDIGSERTDHNRKERIPAIMATTPSRNQWALSRKCISA